MVLDLENADLTSTDFFSITIRSFHMMLLQQILKGAGFPQSYSNTTLFLHGSYQVSLVRENPLRLLPWLNLGLLFSLPIKIYLLEFLLIRIYYCQILFCFAEIFYFTFILKRHICLVYKYIAGYISNYFTSILQILFISFHCL